MTRVRARRLREPVQPGPTDERRREMALQRIFGSRRSAAHAIGDPDRADHDRAMRLSCDRLDHGEEAAIANDDRECARLGIDPDEGTGEIAIRLSQAWRRGEDLADLYPRPRR